ncbi:MAG: methyltransferase domain-containing protein [Leptolyngbyaceae cyanobacterium CRU_2_3]|nr:methyltransferase domain-containing protein [Leptolyngbyaceae cyanobacterium CRU_2_3]
MAPIFRDSKQAIAHQFGQATATYQAQAQMQKDCAGQLLDYLPHPLTLPPGAILEIGCGTGFLTQGLIDHFPDRALEITDLSPEMLQFCQANVQIPVPQKDLIAFRPMDGEAIAASPKDSPHAPPYALPYALIVSGFAIQWFEDPANSLRQWLSQLQPGGLLLISLPTRQSFPEWRQICLDFNLPFTANPLPDIAEIVAALAQESRSHQVYEHTIRLNFENAADFFKSLKMIGAGFSQTGKRLSLPQMRQLIRHWNQQTNHQITVQFHVAFGVFQR